MEVAPPETGSSDWLLHHENSLSLSTDCFFPRAADSLLTELKLYHTTAQAPRMSTDRPSAKQSLSNALLTLQHSRLALIEQCSSERQSQTPEANRNAGGVYLADITAPLDKDIIPWATDEVNPLCL